jgi:hypothetical protein
MASWRSGKLMTFDSANSHVRAHFSEALVVLLREVRGAAWRAGSRAGLGWQAALLAPCVDAAAAGAVAVMCVKELLLHMLKPVMTSVHACQGK